MLSAFPRKISLPVAIALIFIAGVLAGYWRYRQTRTALLDEVAVNARRCAMAFEHKELAQLSGTTTDVSTSAFVDVRERLIRFRRVGPDVRNVYLVRQTVGSNQLQLLATSDRAVAPGDTHSTATLHEETVTVLRRVLATGEAEAIESNQSSTEAWAIGYAQVAGSSGGAAREVLGLEVDTQHWLGTLWSNAMGTAGYVWIFLILPLATLVTRRRQNRQRDKVRDLTEAMEQAQSAVMIVTPKQRIGYANAGFCRQLGYSREELIGREWREFQAFDAPPEVIKDLTTTVGAGQGWQGEWMMKRKDGTFYPVRGGVTPVKDQNGIVRSFVAVFDDVTEIRETESMLREAKERAEAGDRAKGQFLATMSHEVRTPLNGIVGFASLLLDTELTPEQQEFVATIRTSSETLIQLTGDILDYARIESGRLKLEPQPCDPRECVENALDLVAAAAAEKNIELLHWTDDSVPPAISVDVGRLRQVLVNLVNNAVKFTMNGEVEVQVRCVSTQPDPGTGVSMAVLEFSVRDTGIGIALQHHARVFRPFTQVDESTTRRFGGTGLGLAICKNLVELMQGTISFTSELDRGSTFTFTICAPVHTTDVDSGVVATLKNQRVAVIVDHEGFRSELTRVARRLGADVFNANVNTLIDTSNWDVAMVDVNDAIAVDFAARAAPHPNLPPEKMIGLVSIAAPPELRTALRIHFRVLLNKPPHQDTLRSLLGTRASASPFVPALPSTTPPAFHLSVLIVEDNAVNQQLIQRVVSNLGCNWSSASNGRIALDQLSLATPDIILMDLHMPEMDGLTTIKKIRAGEISEATRSVWIIALTADARAEQRERTLNAGANDYLTKPVRLPELMAAFERFARAAKT